LSTSGARRRGERPRSMTEMFNVTLNVSPIPLPAIDIVYPPAAPAGVANVLVP